MLMFKILSCNFTYLNLLPLLNLPSFQMFLKPQANPKSPNMTRTSWSSPGHHLLPMVAPQSLTTSLRRRNQEQQDGHRLLRRRWRRQHLRWQIWLKARTMNSMWQLWTKLDKDHSVHHQSLRQLNCHLVSVFINIWWKILPVGYRQGQNLWLSVGQPHQFFLLSGNFFGCPGHTDNQNLERWIRFQCNKTQIGKYGLLNCYLLLYSFWERMPNFCYIVESVSANILFFCDLI